MPSFIGLGALLMPFAPLVADDRPASLEAAGGNPLALNAVAFLDWYWMLLLVLAGVTILIRLFGRDVGAPARSSAGIGEDPYAIAYLAGGPQRVLDVAMASLVEQGALRVNAVTRELIAEQPPPTDRPKIERQLRALLGGARQVEDAARLRRRLQRKLRASLEPIRDRLLRAGLLARPALQVQAREPLTFGFALLFGIGAIRLVVGAAAGRPIGFLTISLILTGVIAWWLLRGMGRERTTAHGKRLLKECKAQLGRGDDDRVWMVALLGLAGYGMGPMADLHHVMQVAGHGQGGSSGSGCGGGGCGGSGCGGGGCGGCGG